VLTNIHTINQSYFSDLCRFVCRSGTNLLVFSASGGGKTTIAQQVAKEEGVELVYVNLSVMEKFDLSGLPLVSADKRFMEFAAPKFLPFLDSSLEDKKNKLSAIRPLMDSDASRAAVDEELNNVQGIINAMALQDAAPHITDLSVVSQIEKSKEILPDSLGKPIVILFDEVDKASTDTCQGLLEILQFHSVNGRKLNIRGCILTANLPDEHAHTNPLSHAITKRCKSVKMDIDFKLWRNWAFEAGVNELVVGFLITHPEWLYKRAADGDPTEYALPSPRTWEMAASDLTVLATHPRYKNADSKTIENLRKITVAGCVGASAAAAFETWVKYFREIDPYVDELMKNGTKPPASLSSQQRLVMAIASCQKCFQDLKPNNKPAIEKHFKNVFGWLKDLTHDHQIAAVRLGMGSNFDKVSKFNLSEIEEFRDVFKNIKVMMGAAGADASLRAKK
jgi:MoxR-like ATPase